MVKRPKNWMAELMGMNINGGSRAFTFREFKRNEDGMYSI
jgi:hypothetical protein